MGGGEGGANFKFWLIGVALIWSGRLFEGKGGANLRIYGIITELETLWNFVHVAFLKLRMLTSEIHLNSLHVSRLNSEPTALQWNTEIQLQLKISSSISCSYTWTYACIAISLNIRTTIKWNSYNPSLRNTKVECFNLSLFIKYKSCNVYSKYKLS